MCEPTTLTLVSLGISAASAVAAHQQQSGQAKNQQAAIEREARLQQADLVRQRDQQFDAANAEMNEHARQAMQEMAMFDVVAGEYGGGNSVDRARTVGDVQNGEQLATISHNASIASGESSFRSLSVREQALSRIGAIQRPSNLGTALQIGSAAVNAYTSPAEVRRRDMERRAQAEEQRRWMAAMEGRPNRAGQ